MLLRYFHCHTITTSNTSEARTRFNQKILAGIQLIAVFFSAFLLNSKTAFVKENKNILTIHRPAYSHRVLYFTIFFMYMVWLNIRINIIPFWIMNIFVLFEI